MATFTENIENIRKARYGRDVRESIANGLEQAYQAQREFDEAYNNAITEFNQRLEENITTSVADAIEQAVESAQGAVASQETSSINAVNAAKNAALQEIENATGSTGITLQTLGMVYSETEPINPTVGMVWLKPVEA